MFNYIYNILLEAKLSKLCRKSKIRKSRFSENMKYI